MQRVACKTRNIHDSDSRTAGVTPRAAWTVTTQVATITSRCCHFWHAWLLAVGDTQLLELCQQLSQSILLEAFLHCRDPFSVGTASSPCSLGTRRFSSDSRVFGKPAARVPKVAASTPSPKITTRWASRVRYEVEAGLRLVSAAVA